MRGEAHAWHLPAQRKLAAILAVDIAFSANDGSRRNPVVAARSSEGLFTEPTAY
jgi:hypothetical protein